MKKKIAILGSTGSIGKTLLDIINIKKFEIILLTANKNYKLLLHQAKIFNVKNIIIKDYLSFKKALIFNKDKNINIGSVSISSGDWIYVDTNGWVVSRKKLEL